MASASGFLRLPAGAAARAGQAARGRRACGRLVGVGRRLRRRRPRGRHGRRRRERGPGRKHGGAFLPVQGDLETLIFFLCEQREGERTNKQPTPLTKPKTNAHHHHTTPNASFPLRVDALLCAHFYLAAFAAFDCSSSKKLVLRFPPLAVPCFFRLCFDFRFARTAPPRAAPKKCPLYL